MRHWFSKLEMEESLLPPEGRLGMWTISVPKPWEICSCFSSIENHNFRDWQVFYMTASESFFYNLRVGSTDFMLPRGQERPLDFSFWTVRHSGPEWAQLLVVALFNCKSKWQQAAMPPSVLTRQDPHFARATAGYNCLFANKDAVICPGINQLKVRLQQRKLLWYFKRNIH